MSKYRNFNKLSSVIYSSSKELKLGGYRPDPYDENDSLYAANRYEAEKLPPQVDLRKYMTVVENQGHLSSCTANAMAGAYEYLAMRQLGSSGDVSRLFIYYNARSLDDSTELDKGTYLRNCIKVLREYGACTELTWPYHPDSVFHEPSEDAYEEAARFLIEDAHRIKVDLHTMKHCLAEGYPFAFGLTLFSSFMAEGNKYIPIPNPASEECFGGHAMLCVGYSDKHKVFLVRNSWGKDWGENGYCYIPYNYMANTEYCHDCWTIRSVTDIDFSQDVYGDEDSFFDDVIPLIAGKLSIDDEEDSYDEDSEEEETEDSYDEDSDEETEDSYDEDSDEETEDSYDEDSDDETEDSYDEDSDDEDSEDSYDEDSDEEETEDSYDEESEEETEDTYDEDSENNEKFTNKLKNMNKIF